MDAEGQKIQEVLLKSTSLTPEQARHLLQTKDGQGNSLQEALKHNKSAELTLKEVCKRLGVPFVLDIPFSEIPPNLIAGLPIQYVKAHNVLPYKEKESSIQVLTSNPLKFEVFNSLKVKFNKSIEPVMSFNYKIQEAYQSGL